MKKLLLAILLFTAAGFAQDSSQTAKRVWGNNVSPGACTYSATADPVITYNGTLYICSVGGTYVSVGNAGTVTSVSGTANQITATGSAAVVLSFPAGGITVPTSVTAPAFVASGAGPAFTLTERAPNVTPAAGFDVCDTNNTNGPSCSVNGDTLSVLTRQTAGSTNVNYVLHATAASGIYTPSAIAAADLPGTLTAGTAITNAVLTTPNLGTPSAINLTNATNLPTATNFQVIPTSGGASGAITQNQIKLFAVYLPAGASYTFSHIAYYSGGADNSANSYDVGIYGPGCLGGATLIPRAAHIGTTAGSSAFPSTQWNYIAFSGAPITGLQPGWYALAITSSASSPTGQLYYEGNYLVPWNPSTISGGGATLPSTITCPSTSWSIQDSADVGFY